MPSELQAHERTLRFALRFATYSWFYRLVMVPTFRSTSWGTSAERDFVDRLFQRGPIGRMTRLLRLYFARMFPGEAMPADGKGLWRWMHEKGGKDPQDWERRVGIAIRRAFEDTCADAFAGYPPDYRDSIHASRCLTPTTELPAYIRYGGNLARVALRFKAPALRLHFPDQEPRALCVWCHLHPECGQHLLQCPAMPPRAREALDEARRRVLHESRIGYDPYGHFVSVCILRMSWDFQSRDTSRLVLSTLALLLSTYRLGTPRDAQSGYSPIWPVPLTL